MSYRWQQSELVASVLPAAYLEFTIRS